MTGYLPVNGYRSNDAFFTSPALDQQSAISMQKWYVDENYMKTLGIKLVDGRNFFHASDSATSLISRFLSSRNFFM
jgi:putative ABC transport system permease protein